MKLTKLTLVLAILVFGFTAEQANGQSDNVGIGTVTPDPASLLDLSADPEDPKGILIPRIGPIELALMETLYGEDLPGGLLIYEEENGEFWYWKLYDPPPATPPNGEWVALSTTSTNNAFPSGGIIQWAGTIASIPPGWSLCDGSNGTPDLTDKFILSVANSGENPVITNDAVKVELGAVNFPDRRIYKLAYIQKL